MWGYLSLSLSLCLSGGTFFSENLCAITHPFEACQRLLKEKTFLIGQSTELLAGDGARQHGCWLNRDTSRFFFRIFLPLPVA